MFLSVEIFLSVLVGLGGSMVLFVVLYGAARLFTYLFYSAKEGHGAYAVVPTKRVEDCEQARQELGKHLGKG